MATAESVIVRSGLLVDPSEFRDVTFTEMPCPMRTVLGDRAAAITLGDHIFIRPDTFDDVVAGLHPELVVHELVHVAQWRKDGGWFLPRYLGQYFRFRLLGISHETAYRSISYEVDAYAASSPS
jgi:hypothetical protein